MSACHHHPEGYRTDPLVINRNVMVDILLYDHRQQGKPTLIYALPSWAVYTGITMTADLSTDRNIDRRRSSGQAVTTKE